MRIVEAVFWLSVVCVAYTYAGYPSLLAILAWLRPRLPKRDRETPRSVSLVLAVRNEQASLVRRLDELTALIDQSGVAGELIVVSDGSTDSTAAITRGFADRGVHLVELPHPSGKAAALNAGCSAARHEIIVFADARQRWSDNAIVALLEGFSSSEVGAVSGELVLEKSPGVLAGVGLYWTFEKWLRRLESRVHSQVGVTGAIAAVRRDLFRPIPPGTLLDDVYWPMCVALAGRRVVNEPAAKAFDRLPDSPRGEFRRKVRTLAGNFQLMMRLPGLMSPWRNPLWIGFLSHKVMRLVSPWMMILSVALSTWLVFTCTGVKATVYETAWACQIGLLLAGLAGLISAAAARFKLVSGASSFLLLHVAAWWAFWVWALGWADRIWSPVVYLESAAEASPPQ